MNLLTTALNKIFKSGNQQELDRIKPLIVEINKKEADVSLLNEGGFKEKTNLLKKNVEDGRNINEIIPESFALVREAAKRTLGERECRK